MLTLAASGTLLGQTAVNLSLLLSMRVVVLMMVMVNMSLPFWWHVAGDGVTWWFSWWYHGDFVKWWSCDFHLLEPTYISVQSASKLTTFKRRVSTISRVVFALYDFKNLQGTGNGDENLNVIDILIFHKLDMTTMMKTWRFSIFLFINLTTIRKPGGSLIELQHSQEGWLCEPKCGFEGLFR